MRHLNSFLTLAYYISTFIFLVSYLGFFEKRYKTKVSEAMNVVSLLSLIVISSFFRDMTVYRFIILSFMMYVYLHSVFQFESQKDMITNCVYYIASLLVLLTVYSFLQCFFSVQQEQTLIFTTISIFISAVLFFISDRKLNKSSVIDAFDQLKNRDLILLIVMLIFFLLISIVLQYFSVIYEDLLFEILSFIIILFFLFILLGFLYLAQQLCKGYEAEIDLEQIKQKENLNYAYYKRREEAEKEISYLLHDMKNHLQMIMSMNEQDKTSTYLESLAEQIKNKELQRYSSRHVLQVLFDDKVKEAAKQNIFVDIHNRDVKFENIEDFDLVTIFSNLLDNAIEAVATLSEDKKTVTLSIRQIQQMMVIKIKNPAPQKFNKKEDGTLLSTKENHKGLGLSSVRNTVEKYHGDMQIKYTDQMFSVIISIMNEKIIP